MDNQNVGGVCVCVCIHTQWNISLKKEGNSDTYYSMDKCGRHYENEIHKSEGDKYSDSTYMSYLD